MATKFKMRRGDEVVVMTGKDHPSGTDRVLEAAELLGVDEDAIVVHMCVQFRSFETITE